MPGLTLGHDILFHLSRIQGLANELKRGVFPVRLQSSWNYGYGFPVSIFYGDMLLYFPALLYLIGFPLIAAYKLYIFFINALTVLVSYICFKSIFRDKKIGFLLAFIYSTATYRFVDVFIRSAVGEYSSFVFFPIIALAFYRIILMTDDRLLNALILALGFSGLVLTHVLSTEMCVLTLLFICILSHKKVLTRCVIETLFLSVLFVLGACAFFIIPFVDYFINVPTIMANTKSVLQIGGGVYLPQLFAFFQNPFGLDSQIARERMIYSPGLPLMAGFVLSFIMLLRGKRDKQLCVLLVIASFTILLASNIFPWEFISFTSIGKFLCKIQFPWRWLGIAMLFLTLVVGRFVYMAEKSLFDVKINSKAIYYLFIGLILLQSFSFYSNFIDGAEHIVDNIEDKTLLVSQDYLRVGSDVSDLNGFVELSNVHISNYTRDGNSFAFHVTAISDGFVELPVFNFKGYVAVCADGSSLSVVDGANNAVRVLIPAGFENDISVFFREPLLWKIGSVISLCFIILTVILLFVCRFQKHLRDSKLCGRV